MTAAGREIARLHEAFARWFHGEPAMDFGEIEQALATDFTVWPR